MYTDAQSKIAYYSKIMKFFQIALVLEIVCFVIELIAVIKTGDVFFGILTGVIGIVALAMLKIVWKCKWKIEQLKREENV